MLAPILAFTADEAWEFIPGKPTGSVHESEWKPVVSKCGEYDSFRWQSVFALREIVLSELETSRKAKLIGKGLDAKIVISVTPDSYAEVTERAQAAFLVDFRELVNVSQISFEHGTSGPVCSVSKADGMKCERCWHWETDIGKNVEHPTICGRCVEAVKQFKT
jgi:isoleucyl-tRNA synthetase